MKWDEFLQSTQSMPVIETRALKLLFNERTIELQLNRWEKQGKIIQLKRGYYTLEKKYRQHPVFEPYIASVLKSPSYISLEKALEMHHLIPDVVYAITSLTSKRRPAEFFSPVGRFIYRCISREYFWGYHVIQSHDQKGYLADPEKALLDLFYFTRRTIGADYIQSLRLQNIEILDLKKLEQYAARMAVPFVIRAVKKFLTLFAGEDHER